MTTENPNELRAEATDYHQRQPYTVLIGVLFLPVDSCDDARKTKKGSASKPASKPASSAKAGAKAAPKPAGKSAKPPAKKKK